MALDLEPEDWLKRLIQCHDKELPDLRLMDAYYEGRQPLSYLAPEIQVELNDRMRQLIINWPQLIVDALDERLDVEGFRYAESETAEAGLWEMWQANDLDEGSQQAHVDALALRRSYVIVGSGDDEDDTIAAGGDIPIITAESALEVYTEHDPRTRRVVAAIKRWEEPAAAGGEAEKWATLYLPDKRTTFQYVKGQWTAQDVDRHHLGHVQVVPFANRPRLRHVDGTSELRAVIPVSDAACKIASDMMVSAEYHAMPRRWGTGISKDDFADENGQPLGALSSLAGRVWLTEQKDAKFSQFPEAQLSNFHETINLLARIVAALTGLPPSFLGLATDQPPSADAIRASEARLVKRAERRQRAFGEAWERVMRLAMLVRDGDLDPRARSLETVWRDPSTPTYAQKADAVVKLHAAGLLPEEAAWEDMGYSAVRIARLKRMQDEALTRMTAMDLHQLATDHTPPPAGAEPGPTAPGETAVNGPAPAA